MKPNPHPIVRIVRLTFKQENLNDFRHFFRETSPRIKSFEGCMELQSFQDNELPNVVYTLSRWTSAEHLERYRQSDFFKTTWEKVSRWFDDKPQAFTLAPFGETTAEK